MSSCQGVRIAVPHVVKVESLGYQVKYVLFGYGFVSSFGIPHQNSHRLWGQQALSIGPLKVL